MRDAAGGTWYDYDRATITERTRSCFADGREGLALAHVDGDALLVKTFPAVPRAAHAPGEAQIEIYASPAHTYVEVEAQGACDGASRQARRSPGRWSGWSRRLPQPPGVSPSRSGSAPLLAHVRALVAADVAATLAL